DSPTDPTTAVDALFATNNFNAGVLIGKYARAATKGRKVTIAMLDEHAGSSVGALRHNGFLKGFGIKNNNKQIACVANGGGQQTPLRMAALGVAAVVKFANGGAKASGYTDTGLNLIAKKPLKGVPSKSVKYGLANCWG